MTRNQKIALLISILLIGSAIKLPIWKIDIWAPQYPEGLTLQIFANRIDGNLDQINILNHYIGMKRIIPAQMPEFSVIPWFLIGAVLVGFVTVILGRIFLVKTWLMLLTFLSIGGLVDFYRWAYDYGHNLSPDAPIKIPGFSYQPPLLGYKKILNIEAYSLPDWGAYVLGIGILLAFFVIYAKPTLLNLERCDFFKKRLGSIAKNLFLCLSFVSFLSSCTAHPEALVFGKDQCNQCHMQIIDEHFGAEIITAKGRIYKFDSVHCLKVHLANSTLENGAKIFVVDYLNKGHLINVRDAYFVNESTLKAPMGDNVVASQDKSGIEKFKVKQSGKVMNWEELRQLAL